MGYERAEVEALVRKVITRTLGVSGNAAGAGLESRKKIVDAETVRQMPSGSIQKIAENSLITPLARQIALERHISLHLMDGDAPEGPGKVTEYSGAPVTKSGNQTDRVVALGADAAAKDRERKRLRRSRGAVWRKLTPRHVSPTATNDVRLRRRTASRSARW